MTNAIAIAELVSAVAAAFALAAGLEWLCLCGLMQLMPARTASGKEQPARRLQQVPSGLFRVSGPGLHG
jgi:hypothetical protein